MAHAWVVDALLRMRSRACGAADRTETNALAVLPKRC
jgi:hypothetical protein